MGTYQTQNRSLSGVLILNKLLPANPQTVFTVDKFNVIVDRGLKYFAAKMLIFYSNKMQFR